MFTATLRANSEMTPGRTSPAQLTTTSAAPGASAKLASCRRSNLPPS
jgi:hypothetical protein